MFSAAESLYILTESVDASVPFVRTFFAQNEILRELIAEASATLDAITDDSWPAVLDTLAEEISMDAAEKLIDTRLVPLQRELGVDLSTVSH